MGWGCPHCEHPRFLHWNAFDWHLRDQHGDKPPTSITKAQPERLHHEYRGPNLECNLCKTHSTNLIQYYEHWSHKHSTSGKDYRRYQLVYQINVKFQVGIHFCDGCRTEFCDRVTSDAHTAVCKHQKNRLHLRDTRLEEKRRRPQTHTKRKCRIRKLDAPCYICPGCTHDFHNDTDLLLHMINCPDYAKCCEIRHRQYDQQHYGTLLSPTLRDDENDDYDDLDLN